MKVITATYDGSQIVPDQPLDLPPSTRLTIYVESASSNQSRSFTDIVAGLHANLSEAELDMFPEDLSENHDKYLEGQ